MVVHLVRGEEDRGCLSETLAIVCNVHPLRTDLKDTIV